MKIKLFVSSLVILVLLMVFQLPALVFEVLIGLEFAFALGVLIYSLTKHKRAMPGLGLCFCLFSLIISACLTKFALVGFQNGEQIPLILSFVRNMDVLFNSMVSFIFALILLVLTIIVILKESARLSEAAARFALDTMNQKNFDIDNRLSNKEITEAEGTSLKKEVQKESDFYSSMDGLSKILRGVLKANIVITAVNLIGGLMIQLLFCKTGLQVALESVLPIVSGNIIVTIVPMLIVNSAIRITVS